MSGLGRRPRAGCYWQQRDLFVTAKSLEEVYCVTCDVIAEEHLVALRGVLMSLRSQI